MGIRNIITKAGNKAADKVARLSVLSPEQLQVVQQRRDAYLMEAPSIDDDLAEELTGRLLAASSVEVFNEYLNHLGEMYVPVQRNYEYGTDFKTGFNLRYFEITKWVTNSKENSLEKLVNIYKVLSSEDCNIALVFNRRQSKTHVYLAVSNTSNASSSVDVNNYKTRLKEAIKGNFPGAEFSDKDGVGVIPCMNNSRPYSVACASNVPGEKSEKFISQTIEKLLDGIVPDEPKKEYTIVLLATPITDVESRKIHLAELYSGLAPYASWETNYTFTESDSVNSSATFGVNVGASAGVQHGQNQAQTRTYGETDSTSTTETDSITQGETETDGVTITDTEGNTNTESKAVSEGGSTTHTDSQAKGETSGTSTNESHTDGTSKIENIFVDVFHKLKGGNSTNSSDTTGSGTSQSTSLTNTVSDAASKSFNNTFTESVAKNISQSVAKSASKAVSNTVGKSVANTLGKAVSNSVASTAGRYKGINLGANVGANFARASNITATVGKNEGIVQHFTNYNIKHLLENLELQMKRYEQSKALGMWDFAAYVLSEDYNIANNVAYSYLALTQGEKSYVSETAVNLWRGDTEENGKAKEICSYIKELRHPIFALDPYLIENVPINNIYPVIVTATTSLSGKELAYSLNFPQKSISGLPVISCAEFGRDIVSYGQIKEKTVSLGHIFHMNHIEATRTELSLQSLSSHTFITGSTGSGKSNTVYKILEEAKSQGVNFLVIEPVKGEYRNVFGGLNDVSVFSTNPNISPLLKINPFSFPEGIHIYEHMDRLVEIFNVCWPMYAAMPAVLKNAIEKAYEDCGWDLINSENKYGKQYYPSFSDISRNIKAIIESSEYDNESKGAYKGSLLTRISSLANGINSLIFTTEEIPYEILFDSNVVIDLSRVGASETKSLIMGMLVLKLQEYRIACAKQGNENIKHLTVLEEAHNLLKRTSTEQTSESSNLVGKSVEMISNAIAEMRTYGEGFVIVDQAPGLMDMSVIRNTNTKIIMRLPDQTDRELVGKSATLDEEQIKELAKLPRGVAAIYQNEWLQPILCKIDKSSSSGASYIYKKENKKASNNFVERIQLAEMLSRGFTIGREVSRGYVVEKLDAMQVNDFIKVSVLRLMENPPMQPNIEKFAPIMAALFPEVYTIIKNACENESDVAQWTLEANEVLLKYSIDEQVRIDIIQGSITYYFMFETNNKVSLENWIERGGLK